MMNVFVAKVLFFLFNIGKATFFPMAFVTTSPISLLEIFKIKQGTLETW